MISLHKVAVFAIISTLLVLSACTAQPAGPATDGLTPGPSPSPTFSPVPVPAPAPVPAPKATVTPAPTVTPLPTTPAATTPAASPQAQQLSVETVIKNLDIPWALDFAPDGRIFITERPGRIRIVKDGLLLPEPWLTLDVAAVGEGGLLGIALDPQFAQNRYVYAAYTYRTADGRLQNRLVRLREDAATGKGVADKVLTDGVTGGSIHNGGRVKYGPDGKLYWTMGESGNAQIAQDVKSLNGKILRINPDGTVPADNPFPGSLVYSYGNRNPQGLAWQPGTGRLYATEHGPSGGIQGFAKDELNYIEPGKNYGWPIIAGDETKEGMVSPVLQSGSETWAPSGATFIKGGLWDGSLLFAGLRGETLYRVVPDRSEARRIITFEKYLTGQFGRLRDVAQGPDGAIYVLTNNRDGRGQISGEDDRLLKLVLK